MGSVLTDGKVALITGGTSGIGLALARHLHAKGWRVAMLGRSPEKGQAMVSKLDTAGDRAVFEQCDVSSYAAQAAAYKRVWDRWGRLDVVVPNAGNVDATSWYNFAGGDRNVDDIPPEPNTSCTDIHLKAVMYGTLLATHFMRHNKPEAGGKIIATGSIIGVQPCPTFPEYCANEAAITQFVRSSAAVLKSKHNISINVVLMGAVATPAMPGFTKAFLPEHLCTPEIILKAYDTFLEDASRIGESVEPAHDQLFWHEVPEPKSAATIRTRAVYEPWFTLVHGGRSDLGAPAALEDAPEGNTEDVGRSAEFAVGFE